MAKSSDQVRPLAPSLTVSAVQNSTEGTASDLVLTYSPNSVLSLGGVVFRLPEGFTATTNDTINNNNLTSSQISEGGRKVTLPLTLDLLGLAQFTLVLTNKTLPAAGTYTFSAENTVLIIGSLLPASADLTVNPAAFAYVTNYLSNHVGAINRITGTVSSVIPVEAAPLGITISPTADFCTCVIREKTAYPLSQPRQAARSREFRQARLLIKSQLRQTETLYTSPTSKAAMFM
ncbi:member of the processed secretome [Bacillus amyloliquefaciens]|jgi:YVTN family beta-propeller protein|nr:uncharacterized protein S101267_03658 [Bacillus amyloliquefaciens]AZV90857.1 member of the processed secretome [Bacillus amyloliquefaciens]KYC99088.1 hypothetical protein B425_3558 [Bacillus amyloliquefaciens]OBR32138.1 uncharacterized protein SRCM101266_00709 [Bacillus amyloliquefaciens]GLW41769.1 hypothetical protein Bamy01_14140 [Bacillus amyloliquefaciens]